MSSTGLVPPAVSLSDVRGTQAAENWKVEEYGPRKRGQDSEVGARV